MMKSALTFLAAALLSGCSCEGERSTAESHAEGHVHGPHGGHLLEVGAGVAHLEVVHDEVAGKMTIYVLGADAKTALPVATAPVLKLTSAAGPKVLASTAQDATTGRGSVFTVTDDALKGHEPAGRISIDVDGKTYNPDLEHDHK